MRGKPPTPKDLPYTMEEMASKKNVMKQVGKKVAAPKPKLPPKKAAAKHSTGANRAAASRAKPKPEAWSKAVDKYWNPKVKIGGVALPGTRLRYPKNDPKKNVVMNFFTSNDRRGEAMDKQHNRYSK